MPSLNWVLTAGQRGGRARAPRVASLLQVNNVFGMLRAAESGLGLASLPDYLGSPARACSGCCHDLEGPSFTAYFVYPEELKTSKRVAVFRDFLLRRWPSSLSGERHGGHDKPAWRYALSSRSGQRP